MQHSLRLLAASAALSWVGAGASPHRLARTRRAVAQIPGYDFAGCYTEATASRALTGTAYFDDLMTVEKCANACSGYKYFGVEYGRECYCGNDINDGSVEADLADCSFACPGDSSENCGAGNRLNLYTRTSDPVTPTLTTYSSRGCYAEPSGARALASQVTGAADMTVEKCATFCGSAGYTLFGLEYYTEVNTPCWLRYSTVEADAIMSQCYCANVLTFGAVPADAADCKFPCAGNSDELCGGDWRLNLYEFSVDSTPVSTSTTTSASAVATAGPATYTAEGCYTEAQGIRALSGVAYYDDAMTVEKCAAACAGYTWFGVEYGRECYGGNIINSAEGSVPTALSECSFPCPGDSTEKCGAGDRLNVYRFLPAASPSATSTSASTVTSVDTPTSTPTDVACEDDADCDDESDCDDDDDDDDTTTTAVPTISATSTKSTSDSTTSATASDTSSSSADPVSTSTSVDDQVTTSTTTSATASDTSSSSADPTSTSTSVDDQATTSTTASTSVADQATTSTTTSTSVADEVTTSTTTSTSVADQVTTSTTTSTSVADQVTTSTTTSTSVADQVTTSTTTSTSVAAQVTTSTTTSTSVAAQLTTSTTTSSSAAATTSSAPTVVDLLSNGGFEGSGGWTIKTTAPGALTYSFVNTNDPHTGLRSSSVAYSAGSSAYQAWFSQVITPKANTRYSFQGWAKASSANPGCSISYYIGTANGASNLKTMAQITSANLKPNWASSTGFWDSGSVVSASFNVRWTCSGSAARTYYVDDLSLVPASA